VSSAAPNRASLPFAVLAAARRDWLRRWRDPLAIALWIGIPLVIGGLIVLATGGRSGASPVAKVLIAAHDDGFLADLLVKALSGEQAGPIAAELVEEAEGRARLEKGEATALLVIPQGFTAAVWNEWPVTLELVTNPSQRILPGVVQEALAILSEAVFYAHRVFGEDVRGVMDASLGGDELEIARTAVAMQRGMERVGKYAFPPAIELRSTVREAPARAATRSVGAYFLPAMLMMALLFMAEGMADDVWREKLSGALRRSTATPLGVLPSLLGKYAAGWALMLLIALAACIVASVAFDFALWRAALAAAWVSVAGAGFLALLTLAKLFATSQRAAGILGNLVLFPLLMLGGSFVPFAMMPDGLVRAGRLTPNGWAVTQLDAVLFGAVEPAALALSFAGAFVFFALLAWLGARRCGGAFARSEA
jgi:ABC-type multidrug transport system permease subunit